MFNSDLGLLEKMRKNRMKALMLQQENIEMKAVFNCIVQTKTGDAEQDLKTILRMAEEVLAATSQQKQEPGKENTHDV